MALQHAEHGEVVDRVLLGGGPADERTHAPVDVVDRISQCSGASCTMPVVSVMTRAVILCRTGDTLREV